MSAGREQALVWAALAAAAAVAWGATLLGAEEMAAMPACHGTMGLGPGAFLAMWSAMMSAMMLPAVAPVAVLWAGAIRRQARPAVRATRLGLFIGGYLVVWSGLGAVAYLVADAVEALLRRRPAAAAPLAASIFAVAGIWQWSPWKAACLRHCRSPLGHLARYTGWRGPLRDLRIGAHHGLICAACCWALMGLLLAVGLMNVPAMLAIGAFVCAERWPRIGPAATHLAGALLLVLAALAPFTPALRAGLDAGH